MDAKQITIKRLERPSIKNLQGELDAFCNSIGIPTDDQSVAKDIFKEILEKESKRKAGGIRSITISRKIHVTRGGAVYHLNKLMETGLIIRKGREYELRGQNLEETVEEMENDMLRMFRMIKKMAAEIDDEMGFE
ncbi:MAG: hypothetical protein AABY04_03800 [Candidatus Micrarchaeota archaeon]